MCHPQSLHLLANSNLHTLTSCLASLFSYLFVYMCLLCFVVVCYLGSCTCCSYKKGGGLFHSPTFHPQFTPLCTSTAVSFFRNFVSNFVNCNCLIGQNWPVASWRDIKISFIHIILFCEMSLQSGFHGYMDCKHMYSTELTSQQCRMMQFGQCCLVA